MSDEHRYLLDALNAISVESLDYSQWLACGMALHDAGFSLEDWQTWSATDTRTHKNGTPYYSEQETASKWRGFGNGNERVTSGTIIHLAEQRGWRQPTSGMGEALDWGDLGTVQTGPDVAAADTMPIIDVDDDESDWDPCRMLGDYLAALFEDDEHVGYVVNSWERDGRLLPSQGQWERTAGELRQELASPNATMDKVVGAWDERAGAWIRFNPLDGEGCGNANVTDWRFALVESDVLDVDRQFPAIKELHLPCAAVVSSGGKSVHAIVHIDAKDAAEYAKRVRWLYDYCDRHGFVCDKQNKNASRLSRMPGVTRNGRRQLLLATNIGEESWDAWRKWAEESEDDLPDAVSGDWDAPIRLKPPLIGQTDEDCILRQGAKLIVVGDSKMGKSYTLIDLAEAIAVGGEWLGMQCTKGKVFYVNLEIDPEEFRWRQHKVWDERPECLDESYLADVNANFVRWDLRGYATNLDTLAPRLVRRVLSYGPAGAFRAIIIDPIYKVNGGDDNNAAEVSKFTNTLDLIIMRCGCSVIYAHHHPKGATGGRKAIDRMSGSGVYGRDADTVMDFSPLFVPEETWAQYDHKPIYRAEVKCRSFKDRRPIDVMFDWPRFRRDTAGVFKHLKVLGEDPRSEGSAKGAATKSSNTKDEWQRKREAIDDAYQRYPKELERDKDCARDVGEIYDMINWGAFGLSEPKIDTFRGWFSESSGKLSKYYRIGEKKTNLGTFKDCLIPVEE